MFDWTGLKNIVERALSTFIQAFAGALGSAIIIAPLSDWESFKLALGASLGAALLSVRKNLTAELVKAKVEQEVVTEAIHDNRITER